MTCSGCSHRRSEHIDIVGCMAETSPNVFCGCRFFQPTAYDAVRQAGAERLPGFGDQEDR